MARSLGVVLPAFRPEVPVLSAYVREIDAALSPDAIVVELDAPRPGVVAALDDLPASIHVAEERRGKGAAITAGFERLDADVLAFADADASTPVGSLSAVVDPVRSGEAGVAVGSRRHPEATVRSHQTYARRWLGNVFARCARALLDVKLYDYQCGAKAVSRAAWRAVRGHLYEPGFAWDVELVAIAGALEIPVLEVPIEWEDRPGSTVSPIGDSVALGRALLVTRHRARLLRDDPLHTAIETYRGDRPALVDRGSDDD